MSVDTISEDQIKEIMESQSFEDASFDLGLQLYLPHTSEKDGSLCVGPGIPVDSDGFVRIGGKNYDAYNGLTKEQCKEFVQDKLSQSRRTAREVVDKQYEIGKFDRILRYRQDILTSCVYKLGKEKFMQFKKFIPALANGIFEAYFWRSRMGGPLGSDGQTPPTRTAYLRLSSEVFADEEYSNRTVKSNGLAAVLHGGKYTAAGRGLNYQDDKLKKMPLKRNIQGRNICVQRAIRAACADKLTKSSTQHMVKLSETMSCIADMYGVTVDQIMRANPQIRHPSLIYPGIVLNIRVSGATAAQPG